MSRERKYPYVDIFLSKVEVKKLSGGKSVHRAVKNGKQLRIAIKMKDCKYDKQIARLKGRISELRKKGAENVKYRKSKTASS